MTRTVSRTPLMALAVAAVLAVLLSGCGSASAGAAAVVGDRRISVADVQSATIDAQTWVGEGTEITQAQVLYLLAIAPYIQTLATGFGAGASVDDAREVLATRVPDPSDAAVTVLRANISLTKLQRGAGDQLTSQVIAEATKRLTADGFEVNPRYGTFDAKTGGIVPFQPNWLEGSEPVVTGVPAPAAEPSNN